MSKQRIKRMVYEKSWWKSKTIWLNLITLLVGVAGVLAGEEWINSQVVMAITSLVIPILNLILRYLTEAPIEK